MAKVVLEDVCHSPKVDCQVRQTVTEMLSQLCGNESEAAGRADEPLSESSAFDCVEAEGDTVASHSADENSSLSPPTIQTGSNEPPLKNDPKHAKVADTAEAMSTAAVVPIVQPDASSVFTNEMSDDAAVKQCMDDVLSRVHTESCQMEVSHSSPTQSSSSANTAHVSHPTQDKACKEALMADCISALKLCIVRFPLHYKSYYRLAKLHLHDKSYKVCPPLHQSLLSTAFRFYQRNTSIS